MNQRRRNPQIWIHRHAKAAPHLRALKLEELSGGRLQVGRRGEVNEAVGGVFVFEAFDDGTREALHQLATNRLERVVALAVGTQVDGPECWELLRAGAADVLNWRDLPEPGSELADRFERWATIEEILHSARVRETLVGECGAWVAMLREVIEVAHFTDSAVLLTGESGTGKELLARLIHQLDRRPQKRSFIVLDCTTIVPELSGSEFFGHERGAFTHAIAAREGAFALADGGTLFLDEVGELPPTLQAELLRVVQEHAYKRVGSNTWKQTNFRLVCATNRDLLEEEKRGRFRTDFYHRIASSTFHLPSLADRRDDIILLARHFLAQMPPHDESPELTPAVRDYLTTRRYPGNVRELRQVVSRIAQRHVGRGPITVGDIPEEERLPVNRFLDEDWCDRGFEEAIRKALTRRVGLREIGAKATETAIRIALEEEEQNLPRAARRLGVTDRALQLRRAAARQLEDEADAPD